MTGRSTLGLLLAGLLLLGGGFAAGHLVGAGREAPPGDLPEAERHAALGRRTEASPPRVEDASDGARLESGLAIEMEGLRRAVDAVEAPEVLRGVGVITGRIATSDGEPVAGARLRAHPELPASLRRPQGASSDGEDDLTAEVHRYVRQRQWQRSARTEAYSAADGTYRLEKLLPGPHQVTATLDGWQLKPVGNAWRVEPGSTMDFEARPQSKVIVQVFLPDGTQPEKAHIQFQTATLSSGRPWRRDAPELDLEPGTYQVKATAGAHQEYESGLATLSVERGGAPAALRLDLVARPTMLVRVAEEDGEPVGEVSVRAARLPTGREVDPALLDADTASAVGVERGPDGHEFRLADLSPGRYLVGAARQWRGPIVTWKDVEVGAGVVEVELVLPLPAREEYAVLHILGPDGAALEDVTFATGYTSASARGSSGATVMRRPNGEQWVFHHGWSEVRKDEGRLWIEASHPVFGTQRVEYGVGAAPEVTLRFEEPGTLDVQVTGLVGSIYEGRVRARIESAGRDGRPVSNRNEGELDADGVSRLTGLQPGRYEVVLQLGSQRWRSRTIASKEVAIRSGPNRVTVPMPTLYEVAFEGLEQGGFVQGGTGSSLFHYILTPTKEGRALCDGLPAGAYTVRAGGRQKSFTVPGTATVILD